LYAGIDKMSEKKKLKVSIFNKEYPLVVDNEEMAVELARYVDQIMEDTKKELAGHPNETIAVIAALNIAYELFSERNQLKELAVQASNRINKLKLLLSDSETLSEPHNF